MNIKLKLLGAVAALALTSGAANAISLTPPGERVGLDLAAPLPEGVYFVDIGIVGGNPLNAPVGDSSFNGNVPVLAWSTPWTILGGRLQFLAALPEAEAGYTHLGAGTYSKGMYNELLAAQLAWNLGGGWGFSYLAGAYLPAPSSTWTAGSVQLFNNSAFHQMAALSYHQNGWNFTSNVQYSIVSNTGGSAHSGLCTGTSNCQVLWGDYFNYDLALTKTFGKWEVGAVGYGSFDTTTTFVNSNLVGTGTCTAAYKSANGAAGCGKQSQFALGALVGYNFGPVITQLIVANDVYEQNYGRYNTQVIAHVIVPLWNPETSKAVAAKY
jgi:hypothetical protein